MNFLGEKNQKAQAFSRIACGVIAKVEIKHSLKNNSKI